MTSHTDLLPNPPAAADIAPPAGATSLAEQYREVRADTEALSAPLSAQDQTVQSMPDASPTKWHRAHTTWFFEAFLLKRFAPRYREYDARYDYLFNSYYESVGARLARERRGTITRPTADEISDYRASLDTAMSDFLATSVAEEPEIAALIALGLHHEQQHQELLLTDILHAFAQNPLKPAYAPRTPSVVRETEPMGFVAFEGGEVPIGHDGTGFAFDNEGPLHTVLLAPYALGDRPVTNGEWMEFIADGGYRNPLLWLSDGWQRALTEGWQAPLYWEEKDGIWHSMTLSGFAPVDPNAPVCHVSYYEADAFARWRGKRLPTEFEWENAARGLDPRHGHFADSGALRPLAAPPGRGPLRQMFGDVWEWTSSAYAPYPGFQPDPGAVGEYNGKFMVNQMVLRGGSCASPRGHIRATYRNFFYPHQRWQFMGLRLAETVRRRTVRPAQRDRDEFLRDVWEGLSQPQKTVPCKYFYDREGSRLFDRICELPEYYLTRTETALLKTLAPEFATLASGRGALVEFGSGSSVKTRILLDAMPGLKSYMPIDISAVHGRETADRLAADYPRLVIAPVVADFTKAVLLPEVRRVEGPIGFFPGSTIGNFTPPEAEEVLRTMRLVLGQDAMLLVGIDLVKSEDMLLDAYDDAEGITAAFNKNILVRINRELSAHIELAAFSHRAVWNARHCRIEMHLVSERAQTLRIGGRAFPLTEGETIHTENSHKYSMASFAALARAADWSVARIWESHEPEYAVVLLQG